MMAGLTTPIIRSDMRLYPGMPVGKAQLKNPRRQRSTASASGVRSRTVSESSTESWRARSMCELSPGMDSAVPAAGAASSPAISVRPSGALVVSQQYLKERRNIVRKPMTEEQKRKRTLSQQLNCIPETAKENSAETDENVQTTAGSDCTLDRKKSKKELAIRKLLKKLSLGSSAKRTTPPAS